MSREKIKVSLQILDNEYNLRCEVHERNLLMEAAEVLNKKLTDLRTDNPKLPLERLLVLASLQLSLDLLKESNTFNDEITTINQVTTRLSESLYAVFNEEK